MHDQTIPLQQHRHCRPIPKPRLHQVINQLAISDIPLQSELRFILAQARNIHRLRPLLPK